MTARITTTARSFLLSASLLALCACSRGGDVTVPATGKDTVPAVAASDAGIPAFQAAADVGACVNMANHLEAPNEGDWGRPISETDFADIAAAGFQTVRLPVRFSAHALKVPPYTIDPAFMARVTHLVDLAQAAKLRLILNVHNYDALFEKPAANSARFTALWQQIAERFSRAPDTVWFELINEPHEALTNKNLWSVLTPALAAVRATNPDRTVVVGGEHWSSVESLATLTLPDDPHLVATFHYYEPFNFTHQGASWIHPTPPMGRRFGGPADLKRLDQNVAAVRAFMARTGKPVFMGEFGAYESIPQEQRALYYRTVHDRFKAAGVEGCVWGYTNSFPIRVGSDWLKDILAAIGL